MAHLCQRVISLRGAIKQRKRKAWKIDCCNMRTMMDSDDTDRPQRRSALVAKERHRLEIDIAVLSEARFAEEESLIEHMEQATPSSGAGEGKKNAASQALYWRTSLRTSYTLYQ